MYSPLPKVEIFSYFSMCIIVIGFFLWHVYLSGNALVEYYGGDQNLVPGWDFLERLRDISDDEWMAWRSFMTYAIPWIVGALLTTKIAHKLCFHAVSYVHLVYTSAYIIIFLNVKLVILFLLSFIIFYCLKCVRYSLLTWFVGISLLFCNSFDVFKIRDNLKYSQSLMSEISVAWFILKAMDFCLSKIRYQYRFEMLMDFIAYSFYFPTFFFGPFIPFENFYEGLLEINKWNFKKCLTFSNDIVRYFIWFLVIEISSHYFYCSTLNFYLESAIINNYWTLYGIGFGLAQFFYLKYLVYYGLAGTIAKFEGFNSPPPPKCVNRIHLYSNMWRYFDRGYYLFTLKCIYKPICQTPSCSSGRKFLASVISFLFVFIWHGQNTTVFYWSLFNFLGITIEAIGKYLCSMPIYNHFEKFCRTPQNVRRMSCLIVAPVWVLAVVSNYIFFAGHEYGFRLLTEFYNSEWPNKAFIILVAYSFCQVSFEIEQNEKKRLISKQRMHKKIK